MVRVHRLSNRNSSIAVFTNTSTLLTCATPGGRYSSTSAVAVCPGTGTVITVSPEAPAALGDTCALDRGAANRRQSNGSNSRYRTVRLRLAEVRRL
jgi:hypothetical protein